METLLEPGQEFALPEIYKHATMGRLHSDLQVDAGGAHLQYW